jgi:hypothetical protein
LIEAIESFDGDLNRLLGKLTSSTQTLEGPLNAVEAPTGAIKPGRFAQELMKEERGFKGPTIGGLRFGFTATSAQAFFLFRPASDASFGVANGPATFLSSIALHPLRQPSAGFLKHRSCRWVRWALGEGRQGVVERSGDVLAALGRSALGQ